MELDISFFAWTLWEDYHDIKNKVFCMYGVRKLFLQKWDRVLYYKMNFFLIRKLGLISLIQSEIVFRHETEFCNLNKNENILLIKNDDIFVASA